MSEQKDLAVVLAGLRRERKQQSGLDPALVPPDKDSAYRIAQAVEQELGWAVAGWKIAATKAQMQRELRTDSPIYGRVFAPQVVDSPFAVAFDELCSPIPEVEYQARLGCDLAPRSQPYTVDEVGDAVASLHPGIELAECRFIHDEKFPPLTAVLADGSGSGTLIVGPAIENWRDRNISDQSVQLFCDGKLRRTGCAREAVDHPLIPLTWLANELSRTGIGLKAGQVVSTGTMTGMLRCQAGQLYEADFGDLGKVSLQLN